MSASEPIPIVLDTSVLTAAARSRRGASFALVASIPSPHFVPCLSTPLYAEWREVLTRPEHLPPGVSSADALGYLRYLASQCRLHQVHFLWRPFLHDPGDDMVLELAVAAGSRHIITHNVKDFARAPAFGVGAWTPAGFLEKIRSA